MSDADSLVKENTILKEKIDELILCLRKVMMGTYGPLDGACLEYIKGVLLTIEEK